MTSLDALAGSRTALLLLDYQLDFLSEAARLPVGRDQVEELLEASNELVRRARSEGWEVVTIGNAFRRHDVIGNLFRRGAAVAGSPGCALDPRLRAEGAAFFEKWRGSALTNPALIAHLAERQIATLVIAGVFTAGCVKATALDAARRGYQVVVPRNAVADKSKAVSDRACVFLERRGVQVILRDS
ncbi:cysteine hydrolase [bacterium]|nr:cysteine hydrolase [bacterium]